MRDEYDDAIEAELRGHFESQGQKDAALVDSIELPKVGPAVTVAIGEPEGLTRGRPLGPEQGPKLEDAFPEPTTPREGLAGRQVKEPKPNAPASAPLDLSKPMGTPAVDNEMRAAQDDAKSRRSFSRVGQAVSDFTERPTNLLDYAQRLGGGGVTANPKTSMWRDNAAEGDRAVADLEQRRKSDASLQTAQAKRAETADDNDPNGQTAQTYRSVLTKFAPEMTDRLANASPKQMRAIAPWLEKFATENNDLIQARLRAETDAKTKAEKDALHEKERAEDVENRKLNHADQQAIAASNNNIARASLKLREGSDARDAAKDAREAAEKAKGHVLSPSALTDLSDAQTAIGSLDSLGDKFDELGMSGAVAGASSMLPNSIGSAFGTDASKFQAAALLAMQGVGKIMEGGKLAQGDEAKYRNLLPKGGESKDVARQKIAEAKKFLSELVQNRIKVLKSADYNVPAVETGGKSAKAGRVTVSNGKETLEIDAADLADAERDGFRVLK